MRKGLSGIVGLVGFLLLSLNTAYSHDFAQGSWVGSSWEVEPTSLGGGESGCDARTFQGGHLLTVSIDSNQNYSLTFFASGNVGAGRRHVLTVKVDSEIFQLDARVQNLSSKEFIAQVRLSSKRGDELYYGNLLFGAAISVLNSKGQVNAHWSLLESREAVDVLEQCRDQLLL